MVVPQDSISIFVFAAVAASVYAALALMDPYWLRVRTRIRELQAGGVHLGGSEGLAGAAPESRLSSGVRRKPDVNLPDRALLKRLSCAGIYHPAAPSQFFSARLFCMSAPPIVVLMVALMGSVPVDQALLAGCLLGGLGSLVPAAWIDRMAARRQVQLRHSLPDFLDLMVVCLEGGLSLQETIRRVGDELRLAHSALASELSIVQRDMQLGATIELALRRFAERTECDGVRSLSTFIRETQRFGTNITEALRTHADAMRSQREQTAEEKAQKAAVKVLLPTILLIFPAIFVVLVGPAAVQIYTAFGQR